MDRSDFFGGEGTAYGRGKGLINHDRKQAQPLSQHQPFVDDVGSSSYSENGGGTRSAAGTKKKKNGVPVGNGGCFPLDDDVRALADLIARRRGLTREAMDKVVNAAERAIDAMIKRHGVKRAAVAATRPRRKTANGHEARRRSKNGKLQLPALPKRLKWPTKKYSDFYKERGGNIVEFLRDSEIGWFQLLQAGVAELRALRIIDPSALEAIKHYERRNRKTGERKHLAPELRFLREREVTDREIASCAGNREAIKGNRRLAEAVAYRLRHGLDVPGL
jgi:hypothetical protein